ncbi:MAG: hypothetical protein IT379_14250 [Deltaproteobacteria bacterium]|nr:hypothetical protein [Deltaproteobacteria bacterium]
MRRVGRALFVAFVCAATAAGSLLVERAPARAEMWCAYPLWVHEWGVQSFAADGSALAPPVALPSYFHGPRSRPRPGPAAGTVVRDLAPDSGIRALPVLHFYSAGSMSDPVPVAIEVGFTHGEATRWFPQVDRRTPAAAARSDAARAARERLRTARGRQTVMGPRQPLGPDPTSQLEWSRLELTAEPRHTRARTDAAWVERLRAFGARWVNTPDESERFVFYEATTSERVALSIARGPQHRPGHRHYVLRNRGQHAVHDVQLVHRERGATFVFAAPSIPAGATAGFVLEQHRVAPARIADATRGRLRNQLLDDREPAPPREYRWDRSDCRMQRDPAVPVERAEGHRLYAHEVDAILDVWGARFFDRPGTSVVYREDTAYLEAAVPLAVYTDMYNFPLLRRTGLASWTGVVLP